ncbi:hypothetical protein INT45_013201 [Circinella minor]|uniref:Uncharacterized protein n=1 Tax=Circinella minor TaxID=1195481 RepID=A0A8H7RYC6_9FUNG|nr:hypothetical protein INT45_013201 [Circinella minor]
MPRFRSLSTNTAPLSQQQQQPLPNRTSPASSGTSSPTLLARGFRSLRRPRRQSTSVPSSPMPIHSHSIPQSDQQQQQPNVIPLQQYSSAPISTSSSSSSHSISREEENIISPINQELQPNNRTELHSSEQQHQEESTTHGPHIRLVPNVGISNRCFVFDIIDRSLEPGVILKIGRYSDRNVAPDRLSFKSKVVSRSHAELWVSSSDSNKIYIRDVGSSSGTFVNRTRLSPAGVRSSAQEIKDGDLIQLGVDYQGGIEPMYRAVRMRLEVNREPTVSHPFSRAAFQQLRSHLLSAVAPGMNSNRHGEEIVVDHNPHHQPYPNNIRQQQPHSILLEDHSDDDDDDDDEEVEEDEKAAIKRINVHSTTVSSASPHTTTVRGSPVVNQSDIQECCICLYAIAPLQALFIAPCSHIFHFKCLRPILFQNYPGFSCPICRTYSDLEASVAVEVSEVLETLGLSSSAPPKVGDKENDMEDQEQEQEHHHPLRHYETLHGNEHATEIQQGIIEESNHEPQDHSIENVDLNERRRRRIEQSSTRSSSELSNRSRPSQRHQQHPDGGILSTTLVATPPTFEEMLTASSMSPSHPS